MEAGTALTNLVGNGPAGKETTVQAGLHVQVTQDLRTSVVSWDLLHGAFTSVQSITVFKEASLDGG